MSLSRIFTAFALVLVAILAATCVAAQKNAAPSGSNLELNTVFIPVAFTHTLARETASDLPAGAEDPPVSNKAIVDSESFQTVALPGSKGVPPPAPGEQTY